MRKLIGFILVIFVFEVIFIMVICGSPQYGFWIDLMLVNLVVILFGVLGIILYIGFKLITRK